MQNHTEIDVGACWICAVGDANPASKSPSTRSILLRYLPRDPIASFTDKNNMGFAINETIGHNVGGFFAEGSPFSTFTDHYIFYIEGTSILHDDLLSYLAPTGPVDYDTSEFLNLGTTVPAYMVTVGAALNGVPSFAITNATRGCEKKGNSGTCLVH